MALKTVSERIAFINSLELPPAEHRLRRALLAAPSPKGPQVTDNQKGAFLNDGALVSALGGIPAQHQQDVLDSFLLAQLVANKKCDRETDPISWYKNYLDVLGNTGWVIGNTQFTDYDAKGSTVIMEKAVLDLLATIVAGGVAGGTAILSLVTQTINSMKSLADSDGRITLWDSATHTSHAGNFQIVAFQETNNVISSTIGCFYFKTTEDVKKILWFTFSSSEMKLKQSGQNIILNQGTYSEIRDSVKQKLSSYRNTYISNLDI
ncbi:MAG: hypothetical protein ABSH53_06830 [Holophaga sp.]